MPKKIGNPALSHALKMPKRHLLKPLFLEANPHIKSYVGCVLVTISHSTALYIPQNTPHEYPFVMLDPIPRFLAHPTAQKHRASPSQGSKSLAPAPARRSGDGQWGFPTQTLASQTWGA